MVATEGPLSPSARSLTKLSPFLAAITSLAPTGKSLPGCAFSRGHDRQGCSAKHLCAPRTGLFPKGVPGLCVVLCERTRVWKLAAPNIGAQRIRLR
jgi:hypothetical protein